MKFSHTLLWRMDPWRHSDSLPEVDRPGSFERGGRRKSEQQTLVPCSGTRLHWPMPPKNVKSFETGHRSPRNNLLLFRLPLQELTLLSSTPSAASFTPPSAITTQWLLYCKSSPLGDVWPFTDTSQRQLNAVDPRLGRHLLGCLQRHFRLQCSPQCL